MENNNIDEMKETAKALVGKMTKNISDRLPEWTSILNQDVDLVLLFERMGGKGQLSKGFYDLVKAISEAKSKEEEDRIILAEIETLRAIHTSEEAWKHPKQLLLRMLYCEMLGHTVEFGYVSAINMTQKIKLTEKKVGYLASTLFLHPEHELLLMLVNSFRKDLQSSNHLEVCAALSAMTKLLSVDFVPAVQPIVLPLLNHHEETVRKKAVMLIRRFWVLDHEIVDNDSVFGAMKRGLCDPDPSVVTASVCLFMELTAWSPERFKSATSTFVSIQKQLIDHHFPASYNYQRIPSPWLQMKLLNIFANLGKDCRETSDYMYEIIRETMQRANSNSSAGHAIVYECIRTISTIYPCAPLLEEAAQRVSFFLYSNQNNLKYLGLNGVNMLVKVNAKYGDAHQLAVIECLESSDDTIKRKTLDLLVTISSPDNVEVITTKMLMYLQLTKDAFFQRDLVSRVVRCAEEHAPSRTWYIAKMVKLMLLGSKYIDERVVQNIMLILSEGYAGGGGDEEKTRQMRLFAVHEFLNAVQYKNAKQCPLLLQLAAWTIGEFGHLDPEMSVQEMILVVQDLLDVDYTMETRRWVMDALTKLNGRNGGKCPKEVVREFKKFENSKCVELQQICHEFGNMLREKDRELYKAAYPQDGARHIRRPTFSFLDDYAQAAVAAGKGKEYDNKLKESCAGLFDKPLLRAREGVEQDLDYQMPVLKFAAYETPSADPNEFRRTIPKRQQTEGDGEGDGGANNPLRLRPKGSKWTAEGYVPKAATSSSFTKKQVVQQSDLPSQLLAEGEESAARDAIARERKSPTVSPPSSLPSSPPPTAAVALNRPPSPADEKTKLARQLFGGKAANREKPRRAAGTSKSSNRRSSNTMAHQSARQSLEENNVPNDPASLSSEGAEFPEGESSSSRPLSPNSESESGSLIEQDGIEGESGQVKHLDGGDIDQGTGEQGIGEQASSSTRQSSDDLALLLNVDDPNVTPGSSSAPQSAPVTHGAGSNLLLPSSSFSEVVDTFVKKQIGEGRTSNIQTVVADNIAVISVQKLYYPEGPRLLIRVTSTAGVDGYGGGYLSNITLHLSSSDSISTSLEAPSLRHVTVSEEDRNVMTWNELAPDDTFVSCASVVISRVDMQMNIQGKLEYDAGKHSASAPASSKPSRSLSFTIKVLPSDIMRPLVVQNKEMGAVWSSLTQESRFEISPSVLVTTAKQFAKFLEEELNMFAGPVVKNESFGAGQLTDEGKSRVLMHCKVEGIKHLSLKLIIRAGNKLVLEMWMKYVQKLLSP